jgi:hypothetical protein
VRLIRCLLQILILIRQLNLDRGFLLRAVTIHVNRFEDAFRQILFFGRGQLGNEVNLLAWQGRKKKMRMLNV